MQVATYLTLDGEAKAVEYANGVFTVDYFHITHEQVFVWEEQGSLSWATPETAEWAATLRASSHRTADASGTPTGLRGKTTSPVFTRIALLLGAVFAFVVMGLISLAVFLPTARTAPVPLDTAALETTAPLSAVTPADTARKPESTPAAEPAIAVIPATVIRVVDGDTAVFRLDNGAEEKVRFIGVDTPESTSQVEVYGKEASAYTTRSLPIGARVLLEKDVEERDRFGRLLAYVWLAMPVEASDTEIRDKMFNARLALDGYAQQMTIQPNSKYADYFFAYVAEARTADKGLWDPALVSAAVQEPAAAPNAGATGSYVGNRNTRKFHVPTCSSVDAMNPENKVALNSRDQAISQGYVPCKRCNP